MKKIIVFLFCVSSIYLIYSYNNNEFRIDDNSSIRFRIIASDNSLEAQKLKYDIRDDLINILKDVETNDINETRKNIENNMNEIKSVIDKYNIPYKINYGENHFPVKDYNGVKYDENDYESLVITLGEAKGNNWWCFMYPPLCLLDSNKDNMSNEEYTFFFKEILENAK